MPMLSISTNWATNFVNKQRLIITHCYEAYDISSLIKTYASVTTRKTAKK